YLTVQLVGDSLFFSARKSSPACSVSERTNYILLRNASRLMWFVRGWSGLSRIFQTTKQTQETLRASPSKHLSSLFVCVSRATPHTLVSNNLEYSLCTFLPVRCVPV
ncbi:unnamed protein product, partial [Ectocarpus sp. 12 AP-2014]